MTGPKKPNTVRLQNLSYGHKAAAALRAAVQTGLFTKISAGAATYSEIARELGLSELNAQRLMVACAALGLLEKHGSGYKNAPDVERFLVQGKLTYVGPWLFFSGWDFDQWKDLADFLTSTEPPRVLGLYESLTEDMARQYHKATYSVGLGAGLLFARDVDLGARTKILDLGGGSGCYCIAALQKYPHLEAVVFDFEPVCKIAEEFIAEWGLSDRISVHPGNFVADPLPPGADVMIMASNLPQYNEDKIIGVLRKGRQALAPGGEFHLVGETLDDEKDGPLGPALWGLHEALFGSEGRAHSESEVKGYLEKAGFQEVTVNRFIPGSLSRITGRKPDV